VTAFRILAAPFLIAFALAAPLSAQDAGTVLPAEQIPPEYESGVDEWVLDLERQESPFARERFDDTYLELIRSGELDEVVSDMISTFDAVDWGAREPEQQKILRQLYAFLAALKIALQAPGITGPMDTVEEQDAFLAALNGESFGLSSLKLETLVDPTDQDVPGYFADTGNALYLYVWTEDGENVRLVLSSEEVRQWRLLEHALSNLVNVQVRLVRAENVKELKEAVVRWENYLDKGYSQMPWEALLNGYLIEPPELGPPDHQWVVLHPSVGVEFSVDPIDDMRVKESLQIEVLGHVWYRGKDLSDYWGVSATVSLRSDLDPGLGAMVHLKRNWNVGITWHDHDDDPFLFLSVDLFRFARENASGYVERYENLRQDLGLD